MVGIFHYNNIAFKKHAQESWLMVSGEVTNRSGKAFNSVVFRLTLFIKTIPVGNVVITINGFLNGQTRRFEKQIGELEYHKVINDITKYDIYPESAY